MKKKVKKGTKKFPTLKQCEAVIKKHMGGFVEEGEAFQTIVEHRLYKETHADFRDYCREVFGVDPSYARKRIKAAKVYRLIEESVAGLPHYPLPMNFDQAYALVPSLNEPETLLKIWRHVVEEFKANGEPITREVILEAASEVDFGTYPRFQKLDEPTQEEMVKLSKKMLGEFNKSAPPNLRAAVRMLADHIQDVGGLEKVMEALCATVVVSRQPLKEDVKSMKGIPLPKTVLPQPQQDYDAAMGFLVPRRVIDL